MTEVRIDSLHDTPVKWKAANAIILLSAVCMLARIEKCFCFLFLLIGYIGVWARWANWAKMDLFLFLFFLEKKKNLNLFALSSVS